MDRVGDLRVIATKWLLALVFLGGVLSSDCLMAMKPGGSELHLPPDVQKEIWEMEIEHEKEMVQLRAELRIAELERYQLESDDYADQRGLRKNIEKMSDIRRQMDLAFLNYSLDVKKLLTPEQYRLWRQVNRGPKGIGVGRGPKPDNFESGGQFKKMIDTAKELEEFSRREDVRELIDNIQRVLEDLDTPEPPPPSGEEKKPGKPRP